MQHQFFTNIAVFFNIDKGYSMPGLGKWDTTREILKKMTRNEKETFFFLLIETPEEKVQKNPRNCMFMLFSVHSPCNRNNRLEFYVSVSINVYLR